LLLLLVEGDGERAAQVCIELGVPGAEFRESRFRAELGVLVARYMGSALKDIRLGELVREVFATCFRHHIQVAPEMALLGKALFHLEPVCRGLDPDLDPIQATREVAGGLLESQVRRDLTIHRALGGLLELRSLIYDLPPSIRRLLTRAANNELRLEVDLGKAEPMKLAIEEVANRVTLGLIVAALILGSAQLLNANIGARLFGYPVFALAGFVLAAGLGLYVVGKILLSGRV